MTSSPSPRADADDHLDRFLGASTTCHRRPSRTCARGLARPRAAGTSRLAAHLYAGVAALGADRRRLQYRRLGSPASPSRAGALAELARRHRRRPARGPLGARRADPHPGAAEHLRGEYWIGVLEEYGLLPNYTLLDDSVTLDVGSDLDRPRHPRIPVRARKLPARLGQCAARVRAGATFYARGLEIAIDAVDLGTDDSAIRPMGLLPDCGYAPDLAADWPDGVVSACPRCGGRARRQRAAPRRGRAHQGLRRDAAGRGAITDRSDERKQRAFLDRRRRGRRPGPRQPAVVRRRLRLRHEVPAPDRHPLGQPRPPGAHGTARSIAGARDPRRCSGSARAAESSTGHSATTAPTSTGPGAATARRMTSTPAARADPDPDAPKAP